MVDEIREAKYSQSIDFLEQPEQQKHKKQQHTEHQYPKEPHRQTMTQRSQSTAQHVSPNYLSTDTFDFEFDMGRESIHNHMTVSTPQYFMGYCYYCDCPQHSQNYCPLRYCYFCETYGHSSRVCSKKQNFAHHSHSTQYSNFTQQSHGAQQSHSQYYSHYSNSSNFSKHWKKSRRVFKIPFGSTWKDDTGGIMKNESWRKKDRPVAQILFDFDNK